MLVSFAVVLLLLLIFILQNGQRSDVYYLGAHGHLPLGVALLLAAVFGVLLVAVPTVIRIVQLRLMAARHRRRTAAAGQSPTDAPKSTES
jgi:lipopolysaccharide assembly protein A